MTLRHHTGGKRAGVPPGPLLVTVTPSLPTRVHLRQRKVGLGGVLGPGSGGCPVGQCAFSGGIHLRTAYCVLKISLFVAAV